MAQIIEDGLYACINCTIAIANADYSGMSDSEQTQVMNGVRRLGKRGYPVIGDDLGFTGSGCSCCLDGKAGQKYELAILGD